MAGPSEAEKQRKINEACFAIGAATAEINEAMDLLRKASHTTWTQMHHLGELLKEMQDGDMAYKEEE